MTDNDHQKEGTSRAQVTETSPVQPKTRLTKQTERADVWKLQMEDILGEKGLTDNDNGDQIGHGSYHREETEEARTSDISTGHYYTISLRRGGTEIVKEGHTDGQKNDES